MSRQRRVEPSEEAVDAAWLVKAGPLRDTGQGGVAVAMQQIRAMLRIAYAIDFPDAKHVGPFGFTRDDIDTLTDAYMAVPRTLGDPPTESHRRLKDLMMRVDAVLSAPDVTGRPRRKAG